MTQSKKQQLEYRLPYCLVYFHLLIFVGGDATNGPLPVIPEAVTILPDSGAAGVDDALLHNIPTPREFIGLIKTVLSESMVRSIGSVYMFQLSGQEGGVYYLDLKNGEIIFLKNITKMTNVKTASKNLLYTKKKKFISINFYLVTCTIFNAIKSPCVKNFFFFRQL